MGVLYPNEHEEFWAPPRDREQCFRCGETILRVRDVCVYWHSLMTEPTNPDVNFDIVLHPSCAAELGAHLIADAREADLANPSGDLARHAGKILQSHAAALIANHRCASQERQP